jgi:hypothetical protein
VDEEMHLRGLGVHDASEVTTWRSVAWPAMSPDEPQDSASSGGRYPARSHGS